MQRENYIGVAVLLIIIIGAFFYERSKPQITERIGGSEDRIILNQDGGSKKVETEGPAPDFQRIEKWLNSEPIAKADLVGNKVYLVDFMTYSCINCIRTFPYLKDWYSKYKDSGFEIVGVHTPEFAFEKVENNVKTELIEKYDITFPIALDNDFTTWNAYANRFWPAKYLVDIEGNIRYKHFGEGAYDVTEAKIQELLMEAGLLSDEKDLSKADAVSPDFKQIGTPEIYFGYKRIKNFGSALSIKPDDVNTFTRPDTVELNRFYLVGDWIITGEYAELMSDTGSILIKYNASNANIVFEADETIEAKVLLDDILVDETNQGTDVLGGVLNISGDNLYNLTSTKEYEEHVMEVKFESKGVRAFAFTFG